MCNPLDTKLGSAWVHTLYTVGSSTQFADFLIKCKSDIKTDYLYAICTAAFMRKSIISDADLSLVRDFAT